MKTKGKESDTMAMLLRVGGVVMKQPSDFSMEKYNLTKSGRVASGKMKIELIAKKRKFLFVYDVISGVELDTLLSVIDSDEMVFLLEYTENSDVIKSAMVYVGAIKAKKFRTDGVWYWKDVTFDLIEQ